VGFLERPDWTEANWPNSKYGAPANPSQAKKIGSLRGDHKLRTSYLGEASFTVTDPIDFLEPVTFTTPTPGKADLKPSIAVAWKKIPNALGYHLTAISPKGKKLLIQWSAGKNVEGMNAAGQFPQMAEVRALAEKASTSRRTRPPATSPPASSRAATTSSSR
jgi:hypothetical protein